MAEATEEIIRAFLEQNGYLVHMEKKIELPSLKNPNYIELDIVAIRDKSQDTCGLPECIVGEVKSYAIGHACFVDTYKEAMGKSEGHRDANKYKLFNNHTVRKELLKTLKKRYGTETNFIPVIFSWGIGGKHKDVVRKYLKKHGIISQPHSHTLKWLYENSGTRYHNNVTLQLFRMLKSSVTEDPQFYDHDEG